MVITLLQHGEQVVLCSKFLLSHGLTILFQRSSYSGIPAFPTAMAQQNSGMLLEHRSFPPPRLLTD